jgi:hypothetical protein
MIVINPDGSYEFTPATDYVGEEVITYEVCDDGSPVACETATLTINVLPDPTTDGSNNAPLATDDTNTVEQGGTVTSSILGNDNDPDGDVLTVT